MEINKDRIRALTSLSDDELRERLRAAAEAAGIDGKLAAKRLPNMDTVRKKLGSLSDAQIKTLVSALGEDRIKNIIPGPGDGKR